MRSCAERRRPRVAVSSACRVARASTGPGPGTHARAEPCRVRPGTSPEPAYAELLGWYLGDGHVGRPAWHWALQSSTTRLPRPEPAADASRRPCSRAAAPTCRRTGCVVVPCVEALGLPVPPARPGRKHERPIVLRPGSVRSSSGTRLLPPGALPLRRLTRAQLGHAGGRRRDEALRLPALAVHERSEDILGLCCWALDLVECPGGVEPDARQRLDAGRRRPARRADRAEELADLRRGGRPGRPR